MRITFAKKATRLQCENLSTKEGARCSGQGPIHGRNALRSVREYEPRRVIARSDAATGPPKLGRIGLTPKILLAFLLGLPSLVLLVMRDEQDWSSVFPSPGAC